MSSPTSKLAASPPPTTPPSTTAAAAAAEEPAVSPPPAQDEFHPHAIHADPNIPVDANPDTDSAYGDAEDYLSDTTSIASSIMKHRWENGRRYNKFREGEYFAPNDEIHADMMDITHQMYLQMLHNKLHLAPIGE